MLSRTQMLVTTFALTFGIGCATATIPNTRVEDTEENREVLEFLEQYRTAVEARDVGRLIRLASQSYFDDMGTPAGTDDVDFEGLREGLAAFPVEVLAARYQIHYRDVTYVDDRVLVDVRYTAWFRVPTPEGPQWERRLEPHRLVIAREDGQYRIVSGM
jgi:hypothetical protein